MKTKVYFYWSLLLSLLTLALSSLIFFPPLRGGHFQTSSSVIRRYKRADVSGKKRQQNWSRYRQVLDRQWGWALSSFFTYISSLTIQGTSYSIANLLQDRKEVDVFELSEFGEIEMTELFLDSITAVQLQSAIETKLTSIPRFGEYFRSGLDNLSLSTLEKLIQKDWDQYRKALDYEWGGIANFLFIRHEDKVYYLNIIISNTKIVDFKQLSRSAQSQLLRLSADSITATQLQIGLEETLMSVSSWKTYFTLGLGDFSVVPIKQLTIGDKTYPIAQLFQEISKDKVTTFFGLSRAAANQWLKLINAGIYVDKVRNTLLAEYWNQLRSMLKNDFTFLPNGANNLSIGDKSINDFDTLFSNRALTFDDLEDSEKTLLRDAILNQENSPSVAQIKRELQRLKGDDISLTTPQVPTKQPPKSPVKKSETKTEDVQNQDKSESEQNKTTKVSKTKTLTITLASVGGTAVLAGFSGLLYWFLKIRK